ncbi:MAG: sensor histidine kinase [Solirubrobacterales bacterium]|nr:sensor histidine kinase [Solirubrobacterales bacterium]
MDRHALIDRVRRLDPLRVDVLAAAVVTVLALIEAALTDVHAPKAATLAMVPLMCAPLAIRSRAPFAGTLAAFGVLLLSDALGAGLDWLFTPVAVAIALIVTAAARGSGGRLALLVAVSLAGCAAVIAASPNDDANLGDYLWGTTMVVLLPVAAGRAFRNHSELAALLHERARSLEAERDEQARRAVAQERERISAELHDVVAHGVSAMVVQAGAARRIVAAGGDADTGRAAIAEVEATGREALDELRRLLGVLRRGDEALALAPQPSLARVDRLVARLRDEGLPVELVVEGEPFPLPVGLDVTAHRIVEDALGDVLRRDGSAATTVAVRYRRHELELEVADDAAGDRADGGVALRERVALFRGDLQAGRRRGGGHVLRARLPVERGAA